MKFLKRYFTIFFTILIFTIVCNSCKTTKNLTDNKSYIIYPSPPDTARIQFLTSISSSADIEGHQSKFSKFALGERKPLDIAKPYGVEIRNAKIYVCDAGAKLIEIIDLQTNKFGYFIPEGKGKLKKPLNIYVDEKNFIYVADGDRQQVVVFDNEGNYVTAIGEPENFKPTDVFVYDNKIWICNLSDGKIHVYKNDSTFAFIKKFPDAQQNEPEFLYSPINFYIENNKIYVSDFGDFKIKMFDLNGNFINAIGSQGLRIGQFARPKGVAADREENIYVVDAAFENTQIFNGKGQILMFFGGHYKSKGDMWLPAQITIDYQNTNFFEKYTDPEYNLKYLIIVSNQYGPDKINIYGRIELKKKQN